MQKGTAQVPPMRFASAGCLGRAATGTVQPEQGRRIVLPGGVRVPAIGVGERRRVGLELRPPPDGEHVAPGSLLMAGGIRLEAGE